MARKSIAQRMNRDIGDIAVIAVLFVVMEASCKLRWKNDNIQSVCRFLECSWPRAEPDGHELFERRYRLGCASRR
jgi:hypothetical protein